MTRIKTHDGRIFNIKGSDRQAAIGAVKNILAKEAQDKADKQRKDQEDSALKQRAQAADEDIKRSALRMQQERDQRQADKEARQEAISGQQRGEDLALAIKKNKMLEGIHAHMQALASAPKAMASIDQRLASLETAIAVLSKTIFSSANSITEALRAPKEIVKSKTGAVTGIQVKQDGN